MQEQLASEGQKPVIPFRMQERGKVVGELWQVTEISSRIICVQA